MTKNELIVESCRNMAFQDLRDTLSSALDNRDATIAALRAEVERLKGELTQLREDGRVLAEEVKLGRVRRSADQCEDDDEDYANICERLREAEKATDASGALGRAT